MYILVVPVVELGRSSVTFDSNARTAGKGALELHLSHVTAAFRKRRVQ